MSQVPNTSMDILQTALRKERAAYAFYEETARTTHVVEVRDLVLTLKDEEARHVRMIEQKIASLHLQSEA